jgi:hypothetical protein
MILIVFFLFMLIFSPNISFSWVKTRLHNQNQLPSLSGNALNGFLGGVVVDGSNTNQALAKVTFPTIVRVKVNKLGQSCAKLWLS